MTKARNNSTGTLTVGSTALPLGSTTTSVAGPIVQEPTV